MSELDLVDTAVIAAPPERVWEALKTEFFGARAWWVPWNTFEPGTVPPDVVGGETTWTVHPKGVDQGGPKLVFTARTRAVEPARRWAMDYVDGVFRGSCEFVLTPLADGGSTALTMTFRAQPRDLAAVLGRLVDLGHEHSKGIQGALGNLQRSLGDATSTPPPAVVVPIRAGGAASRVRHRVDTDDGASLAVTVTTPVHPDGAPVDGGTAVLVHGWGASSAVWRECAALLLADGLRVVACDLRGHGESTVGREEMSVDRLGRDLGTVLGALAVTDAVLVAHSGGGFATLALAGAQPDRFAKHVQSLVLVATAARDEGSSGAEVTMMGHPVFAAALRRPGLGRRLLGQMTGPDASPRVREENRRLFAAVAPAVRAATFRASQRLDLRAEARLIDLPAVVLSGTEDRIVPPAAGRELAGSLHLGRFAAVHGAGHQLPLEAPERILAAVRDLAQGAV